MVITYDSSSCFFLEYSSLVMWSSPRGEKKKETPASVWHKRLQTVAWVELPHPHPTPFGNTPSLSATNFSLGSLKSGFGGAGGICACRAAQKWQNFTSKGLQLFRQSPCCLQTNHAAKRTPRVPAHKWTLVPWMTSVQSRGEKNVFREGETFVRLTFVWTVNFILSCSLRASEISTANAGAFWRSIVSASPWRVICNGYLIKRKDTFRSCQGH